MEKEGRNVNGRVPSLESVPIHLGESTNISTAILAEDLLLQPHNSEILGVEPVKLLLTLYPLFHPALTHLPVGSNG